MMLPEGESCTRNESYAYTGYLHNGTFSRDKSKAGLLDHFIYSVCETIISHLEIYIRS